MPTNNKTQKESNMLKEILSISGKPGLFKLINNTANALIVESLLDGKRFPAYSNAKIIALEDIRGRIRRPDPSSFLQNKKHP